MTRHGDESPVAAQTSRALGTDHHAIPVDGHAAVELVSSITSVYDEPFADSSAIPTMLLCRAVSERVKVASTGDGGDESFQWVPPVRDSQPDLARRPPRRVAPVPLVAQREQVAEPPRQRGREAGTHASRRLPPHERVIIDPMLSRLVGHEVDLSEIDERIGARLRAHGGAGRRASDLDLYLPDDLLVKVDRASMAASLEARAPFLTPTMCNWALGLTEDELGPAGSKALPRQLAAEILPAGLASLPKRGFSVPMDDWLRGPLAPELEAVLAPSELLADGLLDPDVVRLLRQRLADGRRGVAGPLWALLILQQWRRHTQ